MASDHTADTISISYGEDEIMSGTAAIAAQGAVLLQLAAQGQTVFVSSGDQGAYGRTGVGLNASNPGSQPYVTSVGGTALLAFQTEEVWNLLGDQEGASGGGVSTFWKIPEWQQSYALANGGSASYRNFPDVAAVGSPATGVSVYSEVYGGWLSIGGTSASAPIWAGTSSLANASSKAIGLGSVGFINPALYFLANDFLGSSSFNDVTIGNNGDPPAYNGVSGYFASYGYDNATGWGSINGANYIVQSVFQVAGQRTNPPAAPRGLYAQTTATTATLHWTAAPKAVSYVLYDGSNYYITTSTSYELTGLKPKSYYGVGVYSANSGGLGLATVYFKTL